MNRLVLLSAAVETFEAVVLFMHQHGLAAPRISSATTAHIPFISVQASWMVKKLGNF